MRKNGFKIGDISRNPDQALTEVVSEELLALPEVEQQQPPIKPLGENQEGCECSLDGVAALSLPKPQSKEEEQRLVESFLRGLHKLLSPDANWTFIQPLMLSLEYCARCMACSEECPVYLASGGQEIYRPAYRSEILRRLVKKYLKKGGAFARFSEGDIELNWTLIARLAELAYRCTLCRRCAQSCTRGVDNALVTRELRKLFSQEMGIAPKELHNLGTMKQLKTGASTGLNPKAFGGIVQFMEDEIEEKTGKKMKIPVDKQGADILLVHNSGEYLSWMENPEAFAIIFEAAGLNWTLSSELYEATNYGVWYDDVQFARVALRQVEVARRLGVKKIVIGECGHAHKALTVVADRLFDEKSYIPRESCLPLLEEIVLNGKLDLDPSRNSFPVTLHDPCNMVRLMGIVEPQRRILRRICTDFREMTPHGVENYCCGGGSGFAIMSGANFTDWRTAIAGRMKTRQILDVFEGSLDTDSVKYVCAPCSNCKGQLRDLSGYYGLGEKHGIVYGGLVELIVNAMRNVRQPYIKSE